MSHSSKLYSSAKNDGSKNAKSIDDRNSFFLTIDQALAALAAGGKWDKVVVSEMIAPHIESKTANLILELKISKTHKPLNAQMLSEIHYEATDIYHLLYQLSKSKVKVLDLSSHEFDKGSLNLICRSLEQCFTPRKGEKKPSLEKIILGDQPQLGNAESERFQKIAKIAGIEIQVAKVAPSLKKT